MKKKKSNDLKIASKAFLTAGAVCGIAAVFCPPVAIAGAALSAVSGALELAGAVEKKKEANEDIKTASLNKNDSEFSKNSKENTVILGSTSILNPDAKKDNVSKFKKRKKQNSADLGLLN